MTETTLELTLNISSYWHPGTGRGSGTHVDAIADTDQYGLPFVAGKHLKGLLRDAVWRLQQWGQLNKHPGDITSILFGTRNVDDENTTTRDNTVSGYLRFSSASMPQELQEWLAQAKQQAQRQELFRDIYRTAIEQKSGIAKPHSLRGIQAVIPLQLHAEIDWIGAQHEHYQENWQSIVKLALPLIRAIGGQRNRGYGRVELIAGSPH